MLQSMIEQEWLRRRGTENLSEKDRRDIRESAMRARSTSLMTAEITRPVELLLEKSDRLTDQAWRRPDCEDR